MKNQIKKLKNESNESYYDGSNESNDDGTNAIYTMNGGLWPINFQYCEDPMKELNQCTGAIIRQEIEMFEIYSGCEKKNKYQVFIQSSMRIKYPFQYNERSGYCSRCWCSNDCRSLNIEIRYITTGVNLIMILWKIYSRAEKLCAMGCCFLCKPHIDASLEKEKKT